jgi:zinc transporter 1/2/3
MSNVPFLLHKLVSTGALLFITVLFSYLPFVIKRRVRKAGIIMSYCNCLAGGIVLGAMLMHMIPEMMEGCDGHSHAVTEGGVAKFSTGVILNHKHDDHKHVTEKKATTDKDGHNHDHGQAHAHSHDDHGHSHGFAWGPFAAGVSFLVLFAVDRLFLTHSHCDDAHPTPVGKKLDDDEHEHGHECSHSHDHSQHHKDLSLQRDEEHGSCHEDDVIGGCHMDGINASSSKAQTFVFVVALSIHSFLEGLGMATKSTWNGLLSFLVSLFAHKWLEAFALGTGVAKACFPPLHSFCLIFIYSVLTPAGILIGMWMDAASQSSSALSHELTHSILDGLALGSFLFVSCIEMIPSEFHKQNKHSPYKFLVLCVGFFAMAAISLLHFH